MRARSRAATVSARPSTTPLAWTAPPVQQHRSAAAGRRQSAHRGEGGDAGVRDADVAPGRRSGRDELEGSVSDRSTRATSAVALSIVSGVR
jgi:hypothetical protein